MKKAVLIIHLNKNLRSNLAQHLKQELYEVWETHSEKEAFDILGKKKIQVILLGLDGLKTEGLAILRGIRRDFSDIQVITLNSTERFDLSLEGMRLGAFDDLLVPVDLDALMQCIQKAYQARAGDKT